MHFGLTNSPATFQRLLDRIMGAESEPHAFAYLDDIINVSKKFDEYIKWLTLVLMRVAAAGLNINPE